MNPANIKVVPEDEYTSFVYYVEDNLSFLLGDITVLFDRQLACFTIYNKKEFKNFKECRRFLETTSDEELHYKTHFHTLNLDTDQRHKLYLELYRKEFNIPHFEVKEKTNLDILSDNELMLLMISSDREGNELLALQCLSKLENRPTPKKGRKLLKFRV